MFAQRRHFGLSYLLTICLLHGGLLPISASNRHYYDIGFVFNLTKQLYLRHSFESFVTFASERKLEKRIFPQLIACPLDRILMEELSVPLVIWGSQDNVTLYGTLRDNSMVLAKINDLTPDMEPLLNVLDKTLNNLHDLRVLFIKRRLRNETYTEQDIREFFQWCWNHNFINAALTFQWITVYDGKNVEVNELYTYTPFPKLKVLNVSAAGINFNWKLLNVLNVQGYQFRVPIFPELLGAFQLPSGQISGVVGFLLEAYIQHVNGRMRLEATPHVNRHNYHATTFLLAARNKIDIGVHVYTEMTLHSEQTQGVSMNILSDICLMVPWQRELPVDRVARYSIKDNGFMLVLLILTIPLGWQLCTREGGRGLSYALSAFFLQSIEGRVFSRLINAYKFIHIAVLFASFSLWNLRSGYLSSTISTNQLGRQINTVDNFLKTSLRIMVTETEVSMYFTRGLLPRALQPRLVVVNSSTLMEHRESLNTSFAYCVTREYWQVLQLQQEPLIRPIFRRAYPNLCTPKFAKLIPVQHNSPFQRDLGRFYMVLACYGFIRKYLEISFIQARQLGLLKLYRDDKIPFASFGLEDFSILFKIYASLCGVCVLCFLCEIMWNQLAQITKRRV